MGAGAHHAIMEPATERRRFPSPGDRAATSACSLSYCQRHHRQRRRPRRRSRRYTLQRPRYPRPPPHRSRHRIPFLAPLGSTKCRNWDARRPGAPTDAGRRRRDQFKDSNIPRDNPAGSWPLAACNRCYRSRRRTRTPGHRASNRFAGECGRSRTNPRRHKRWAH